MLLRALRLVKGAILPGAILVSGCTSEVAGEDEYSDKYRIDQLNASYGAFADEGNLRVFAALLGEKGFVRLRGADRIEITVDGQPAASRERIIDKRIHYIAELAPPPGATEISIAFVRGAERVVGTIKLAGAFAVPGAPATLRIGDVATLDVDPRPDPAAFRTFFGPTLAGRAELHGDCLEPSPQQIPLCAEGSTAADCKPGYPMRLDTTKIKLRADTTSCEVAVQVRLVTTHAPIEGEGPEKTKFKGGGFEGHRLRSFTARLER